MELALKEAIKDKNEVPIGCVIVKDNKVIAKAHNKKEAKKCAIRHAEIEAILKATKKLDSPYLIDCDMYVTLEPCIMCAGAIINTRIKNIYYSTSDPKGGALGSNINILDIKKLNHYPNIYKGLKQEESSKLLKQFFKDKR